MGPCVQPCQIPQTGFRNGHRVSWMAQRGLVFVRWNAMCKMSASTTLLGMEARGESLLIGTTGLSS
ncbi:hypothetical protein GMOD_00009214 [Pyrenophora seminiperda CCB06]|uniref:Uncharacterized protein n=1 Tax=Pyrenophora seminiperda CCB06 TaxID=1302712 RepID=A0A3M7MBH7_9PLEO|nr:hypothetical protein GMOD_00009214 [Pyrenophora seminiperda CCB06]